MSDTTGPKLDSVDLTRKDGVTTVTLARPGVLNALNSALKRDLAQAIKFVSTDIETRCVVITGEGRAFCAGGDVREMDLNDDPVRSRARLAELLQEVFVPLIELQKPTIAAINGPAFGAGLSLAVACDITVAAESATLSFAFLRMGLIPDCGALFMLPRLLPMNLAKELVFTGRTLSASEARDIGLINDVRHDNELFSVVEELARSLAQQPSVAMGMAKQLLDASLQVDLQRMSALEANSQAILYTTVEHRAARKSFVLKPKGVST